MDHCTGLDLFAFITWDCGGVLSSSEANEVICCMFWWDGKKGISNLNCPLGSTVSGCADHGDAHSAGSLLGTPS